VQIYTNTEFQDPLVSSIEHLSFYYEPNRSPNYINHNHYFTFVPLNIPQTIPVNFNISNALNTPLGISEYVTGEIRVNGRRINSPFPSVNNGVTILPVRAITEALGLVVGWSNFERRVNLGENYILWIGEPLLSRDGGESTIEFGPAPVIIEDRTFVPISFFNYGMQGTNATIYNGVVIVNRSSTHPIQVSVPNSAVNLWSYSITGDLINEYANLNNIFFDYTSILNDTLVIWTDTPLRDFQLNTVYFENIAQTTNMSNLTIGQVIHSIEELTPELPFILSTSIEDRMSTRAISFLDENNIRQHFLININRIDNSVWLSPFGF